MKNPEAIEFLRKNGWQLTRPPKLGAKLVPALTFREIDQGEVVYHVGDPTGGLIAITSGTLSVELAVGPRPLQVCFLLPVGS